MPSLTAADLLQALREFPLLQSAQQVEEIQQSQAADPKALLQTLVQRGWLTRYQAQRLLLGQAAQLVLGHYVILEPLGEGGMGQIFKGRHTGLGRLAALKLLRQDLVADLETVQRFLREIKLASGLPKHPHLVHAYDAGIVDGTYFLAMEYIDGIDLDRLVEQAGPLPVAQACEYVRQAALGLHHAHEHGLIHRDIKPANLLVTPKPARESTNWGTVKVLDLGLARLHGPVGRPGQTILTTDGTVTMGTIDYQAPEQALDFHRADIRADIYSLGCTLYYLLLGRPPFGGGSLAIKLMRHQQAEPPDLQELRPDVPDALLPIVRRMLAKNPAERYQTPGEAAAALAAACPRDQAAPAVRPRATAGRLLRILARAWMGTIQQVRRHPRVALCGTAGLTLAVLVLWLLPAWRPAIAPPQPLPAPATSARDPLAERSPLEALDPARIKSPAPSPEKRPAETVAVITGHRLAERFIQFSPDARFLAACGDTSHHELALYDLAGPEPKLYPLHSHNSFLHLAAFSPDGRFVASVSNDQSARLWSLGTLPPRLVGPLPVAAGSPMHLLMWSPNNTMLACAAEQGIQVWQVGDAPPQRGATLPNLTGPAAFTPHGYLLACALPNRHTLRLFNGLPAEPAELAALPVGRRVTALALASQTDLLATGDEGSTVQLWDLKRRPPTPITLAAFALSEAWTTSITALAMTRNGRCAAAGTNYGYLRIWDLHAPEPQRRVQAPPVKEGQPVANLVFSPDGQRLVEQAAGSVRLWEVSTGQKLRQWDFGKIDTVSLAPDGRHLAIGAGNNLFILRLAEAGHGR